MSLAAGDKLGPYEIVASIGAGGMGEVYRARDTRLGRPVAIKVINKHLSGRFEREARAISMLNHPNICTLYDVGPDFLVMELVEGETLAARLRDGPLPAEQVLRLAIEIADALANAHAQNMVHRDLKPANVMISTAGRVKLLDFGLAKMLGDSDPEVTRTVEGAVLGTFAYMSPEQLQGKAADTRSDIFAFGAVLYEMVSGKRAFAAAVSREEQSTLTGIPAEVAQVIARCLRKDPDERYARMEDVKSVLERSSKASHSAPPESEPSIAVLPFANLSADKENEYFSDGLAEEILNALTRVRGLMVTARTSAFAFRGKEQDIRKVGEALGVRTVLEGSVRRAGNRIRVSAQLINVSNGYQLWSERYDREMNDIFAVQDEISQAIVETLKQQLAQAMPEGRPIAVGQPTNIDAYHAYLKSRYYFFKLNPEDLARSKAYADEAIALDPNYAPAHLALARYFGGVAGMGLKSSREMAALAKAAALKAVELNETESGAHVLLGQIAGSFEYDWKEALRRCGLALACEPVTPEDRAACGQFILIPLGRLDEAAAVVQKALTADPLSPLPHITLATVHMCRGSYDHAIEEVRRVLEIQEDFWVPHNLLGAIYTMKGMTREAITAFERAVQIAPWNGVLVGLLAGSYAKAGDRARGEALLARLDAPELAPSRSICYGMFHVLCSEFEPAADYFEQAVEARHPVAFILSFSPLFKTFRETPRGRALLQKMNLADVATRSAP